MSERVGLVLIVLTIGFSVFQWRKGLSVFGGDFLSPNTLSFSLAIVLSVKLFQSKTFRDWIFVLVISFFAIILAAGVSINVYFILCLSGFLLSAVSAVVLIDAGICSRSVERVRVFGGLGIVKVQPLSRLWFVSLLILIFVIVISVPLFFLFPRTGSASFGGGAGKEAAISGFSNIVSLGEIGSLKLSDKLVMRARISGDVAEPDIYWRGVTLETFDGRKWRRSNEEFQTRIIKSDQGYFSLGAARNVKNLVVQEIFLEPIGAPTVFSLPSPVSLSGNFGFVSVFGDDTINSFAVGDSRVRYLVRSEVSPAGMETVPIEVKSAEAEGYLQLPSGIDPRISALAQEITRNDKTTVAKSISIEKYLRTQFEYSTDLRATGSDPLSDFLFRVRSGHCEYFSSAMAIMLRTQGIESRVVNGFQRGEYNKASGMYTIRERDAHSWVEVLVPETGRWRTFDPTPSAGRAQSMEFNGFLGTMNGLTQALEDIWITYFVAYDNVDQETMFSRIRDYLKDLPEGSRSWTDVVIERLKSWSNQIVGLEGRAAQFLAAAYALGFAFAGAIVIICTVFFYRYGRHWRLFRRIFKIFKVRGGEPLDKYYQRFEVSLNRRGFSRRKSQTAIEFATSARIPEALSIAKRYSLIKFGGRRLSEQDKRDFETWLNCLESRYNNCNIK